MSERGLLFKRGRDVPRIQVLQMWGDIVATSLIGVKSRRKFDGGTIVFHNRIDTETPVQEFRQLPARWNITVSTTRPGVIHVLSESGALMLRARGRDLPLANESTHQFVRKAPLSDCGT